MAWKHWLSLGAAALSSPEAKTERRPKARLRLEPLEQRDPAAGVSATLAAGTLTVAGTAGNDHILIRAENGLLIVTDKTGVIGQFKSGSVTQINVNAGAGNDLVRITSEVKQKATIDGGTGKNTLQAGGGARAGRSSRASRLGGRCRAWMSANTHGQAHEKALFIARPRSTSRVPPACGRFPSRPSSRATSISTSPPTSSSCGSGCRCPGPTTSSGS